VQNADKYIQTEKKNGGGGGIYLPGADRDVPVASYGTTHTRTHTLTVYVRVYMCVYTYVCVCVCYCNNFLSWPLQQIKHLNILTCLNIYFTKIFFSLLSYFL
jgi:hypothetical protein